MCGDDPVSYEFPLGLRKLVSERTVKAWSHVYAYPRGLNTYNLYIITLSLSLSLSLSSPLRERIVLVSRRRHLSVSSVHLTLL